MNNNKRLKPNLLDPIIGQKIIKTLNPPVEDYWAPTKNNFVSFYHNYIKQNTSLIIMIVIIILFLIYRYRITKKERESLELEQNYLSTENTLPPRQAQKTIPKEELNEYTNMLLNFYNQQKETLREPSIETKQIQKGTGVKLAYPMYPYSKGSLAPSGSR